MKQGLRWYLLKNKWRMNQKIKNYQDEYMRLRGALSTSAVAMKGKPTSEITQEHEHTLIPRLGLQMFSGLRNRNEFLKKTRGTPNIQNKLNTYFS